jgi:hypothetical protein
MVQVLIICWMLLPDCWSLSTYKYFSYGSNMVPETMTVLRDLRPLGSTAAVLPDYKLRFSVAGIPGIEPSAAAVEWCAKQRVHGVLYELTEADFERVGRTEGVPFGYQWRSCRVYPYIGDCGTAGEEAIRSGAPPVSAYTLVATRPTRTDIPPGKAYKDLLIEGAKLWKLDGTYAEKLEVMPSASNLLFKDGLAKALLEGAQMRKTLLPKC